MFAVYAFDAYGTLFDVHSAVARHRAAVGPAADRLSELWRLKQLEYSWVRSLAGAYRDFWSCTEAGLDYAAALVGGITPATRADLLSAYATLAAFPDVAGALAALRAAGAHTAILSNGAPAMLEAAVASAGLEACLDTVLSVDAVSVYKTDPRAYALVTQRFGCAASAVSFQSSNRWDIAGAAKAGFRTVWINRSGNPDEYRDLPPNRVAVDLSELAATA